MPSAWLTNFMASLETGQAQVRQPTTQELAAQIIARSNHYNYKLDPAKSYGLDNITPAAAKSGQKGPSTIQRIMDVLSRPLYGISNAIEDVQLKANKNNPNHPEIGLGSAITTGLHGLWTGLEGKEKTTTADIFKASGRSSNKGFGAGVRNFALDTAVDPLNLIPGAAIAKGIKAARGAKIATKVAEGDTAVARVEKALNSPSEVLRRTSSSKSVPNLRANDPARVANVGRASAPVDVLDPVAARVKSTSGLPRSVPTGRVRGIKLINEVPPPADFVPKKVTKALADVVPAPTRNIDVAKLGLPPRAVTKPGAAIPFKLSTDRIAAIEIARAVAPKAGKAAQEYQAADKLLKSGGKIPLYHLSGKEGGKFDAKAIHDYLTTGKIDAPSAKDVPDYATATPEEIAKYESHLFSEKSAVHNFYVKNIDQNGNEELISLAKLRERVKNVSVAKKLPKTIKDVPAQDVLIPADTKAWRASAKEAGLTQSEIKKVLDAPDDATAQSLLQEFADKPIKLKGANTPVADAPKEIAPAADIVEAAAQGSETAQKALVDAVDSQIPRTQNLIDEKGGRAVAKVADKYSKLVKAATFRNATFNPAKQANAFRELEKELINEGLMPGFKAPKEKLLSTSTGKIAQVRRSIAMHHLQALEDAMTAAGHPPVTFGKPPIPMRMSDLINAGGGIQAVMKSGTHLTDLFGNSEKLAKYLAAHPDAAQLVEKNKAAYATYTADLAQKGTDAAMSAAQKAETDPALTATEASKAVTEAPNVAREVVQALSDSNPQHLFDGLSQEAKVQIARATNLIYKQQTTGYKIPAWLQLKEFAGLTDEENAALHAAIPNLKLPQVPTSTARQPLAVGDNAVQALNNLKAEVKDFASKLVSQKSLPNPEAANIAAKNARELIRNAKPPQVRITQQYQKAFDSTVFTGKPTPEVVRGAVAQDKAAMAVLDTPPVEVASEVSKAFDSASARGLVASLARKFKPDFQQADLRPIFIENRSLFQTNTARWAHVFNDMFKTYPKATRITAFKALQKGQNVGDDITRGAARIFQDSMESMFGASGLKDAASTDAIREALTVDDLNTALRMRGSKFQFTNVVKDELGNEVKVHWLDSWKYHDLGGQDPVEFLKQMRDATDYAMMHKTMFDQIATNFGKATGTAVVNHPRLAGVKFDPEMASQVKRFVEVMDEVSKPNGKFAMQYDTALRAWKSGVTIYSPAHHIRNFLGDTFIAWLAGVNNPRVYAKAATILKANRHMYSDMGTVDNLLGADALKAATSRAAKTKVVRAAGKNLDAEQVYTIMYKRGLLPHSKVVEDIPGGKDLGLVKPLGGRGQKVARGVSESREHFSRIAHFVDALGKSRASSLDAAIEEATRIVRKWHPDGLDMTNFEHRYVRRVFPFYSWTRKAVPLLVEGAVKRPAKIIAPNKALYNLQISMGIDPESLSEPFPVDKEFPDWIRDMAYGPVAGGGKYIVGSNLNPFTSVGEQIVNDPRKGAAGMLTPFIRVPGEIASQSDWQTGQPMNTMDKTEYIDKQIPLVSTADRLTNGNLGAGSVEALVTGNPNAMVNHKVTDKTVGSTAGRDAFLNYLLAAGIINTQTPANLKSAEFDRKDRLAAQARKG